MSDQPCSSSYYLSNLLFGFALEILLIIFLNLFE